MHGLESTHDNKRQKLGKESYTRQDLATSAHYTTM